MRAVLALALVLASLPVRANVFYAYTGNPYTTFQDLALPAGAFDNTMRVSGIFELAAPIAANTPLTDFSSNVVSFSFSNGRNTLTQADPRLTTFFFLQTDASGRIDIWDIVVQQSIPTSFIGSDVSISSQNDTLGALGLSGVTDRGQLVVCEPSNIPRGLCISLADIASVDNLPGTWSSPAVEPPITAVAEPETTALMALGLGWIALAGRRRRYRVSR